MPHCCPTCHGRGWVRKGEKHNLDKKETCRTCAGDKEVPNWFFFKGPRPEPIPDETEVSAYTTELAASLTNSRRRGGGGQLPPLPECLEEEPESEPE